MIRINFRAKKKSSRRNWVFNTTVFMLALLVGTLSMAREEYIIDGRETEPGEYPAVYGLKFQTPGDQDPETDNGTLCTAFLVHPRLLLTAAHCFRGITRIRSITNGRYVDAGASITPLKYRAFPEYEKLAAVQSERYSWLAGAVDIGYVVLRQDAKPTPLEVFPTLDDASRKSWREQEATLVGYGANKWQKTGIYDPSSGAGLKRVGLKAISWLVNGLIYMAGAPNGVLPGDSGGPLLLTIDGKKKVVALHHMKTDITKQGNPKVIDHYGLTIETPLSIANLCWVQKDSGIQIPGVVCP